MSPPSHWSPSNFILRLKQPPAISLKCFWGKEGIKKINHLCLSQISFKTPFLNPQILSRSPVSMNVPPIWGSVVLEERRGKNGYEIFVFLVCMCECVRVCGICSKCTVDVVRKDKTCFPGYRPSSPPVIKGWKMPFIYGAKCSPGEPKQLFLRSASLFGFIFRSGGNRLPFSVLKLSEKIRTLISKGTCQNAGMIGS